jgi:hypothetical protein
MKLIIPKDIEQKIARIAYGTELETGVTLFGERMGDDFKIVGIAGPMSRPTTQATTTTPRRSSRTSAKATPT